MLILLREARFVRTFLHARRAKLAFSARSTTNCRSAKYIFHSFSNSSVPKSRNHKSPRSKTRLHTDTMSVSYADFERLAGSTIAEFAARN